MDTLEDPLIAHKRRVRQENEAKAAAKLVPKSRALGAIVVVPSPMDVALGYRFIVPDEGVLPRNAKLLRRALRKAGWWAYVNMIASVLPAKPATEKVPAKPAELVYSYGVHGFSSYPPGDGVTGLVAYWGGEGEGFSWACRADYRDGTYWRTYLGWPDVSVLLREVTG